MLIFQPVELRELSVYVKNMQTRDKNLGINYTYTKDVTLFNHRFSFAGVYVCFKDSREVDSSNDQIRVVEFPKL